MEALSQGDPRQVGGYRIHARLGSGGMGRVYLGLSPSGRTVALKIIHPELSHDRAFLTRFRSEVSAVRQVSSAYTAPVVDACGEDENPPWLATAFVSGPSLAEAVTVQGPLAREALWRLAAGLVEGLAVIHAHGLVHRDLKPPNVLLAADGPRVIDFGISRALDATTVTTTGMIVGTPSFMSPEQAEGLPAGPSSDVFSLGCVLAYAATGAAPFGTGTPASIIYRIVHTEPPMEGISAPIGHFIARCLTKNPAERATLAELMDLVAAQALPVLPALAFWPPDVGDVIKAYQARLDSLPASGHSPRAEKGQIMPSHELTELAVIHQEKLSEQETITSHHFKEAASSPRSNEAIFAKTLRKLRGRTLIWIGAVAVVAITSALTFVISGAGNSTFASCSQQFAIWKTTRGANAIPDSGMILQSIARDAKALNYFADEYDLKRLGAVAAVMQKNPPPSCVDTQNYWPRMIQAMRDAAAQSSGTAAQSTPSIQRSGRDFVKIGNDASALTQELSIVNGQ